MKKKAPPQSSRVVTGSAAPTNEPDRSSAYYHYGLAHLYEQMAVDGGRPDYATQAIEEYKLALNADPNSTLLQNGLAELYFRLGRVQDAVNAAKDQIKRNPNDVEAHTLLGQVYVRSLGDMTGPQSQQTLAQAIAEYETIARLKPNDIEAKLLLGELYAANHESPKAEAEFKEAQKIDSNSEEVVLSMAKLYNDEGDLQRAAGVLAGIPQDDRSAREEYALGQAYDRLKKAKEAAAAYKRSLDLEPDNAEVEMALANALLEDNQLDESLKIFKTLQSADPTDLRSTIQISEIQRRQGHYEESLATLEKLKGQIQPGTNEELQWGVDEALDYDAMGKYDQATGLLTKLVNATTHPDGKYFFLTGWATSIASTKKRPRPLLRSSKLRTWAAIAPAARAMTTRTSATRRAATRAKWTRIAKRICGRKRRPPQLTRRRHCRRATMRSYCTHGRSQTQGRWSKG